MTDQEKQQIIKNQRAFFRTGVTYEIPFRIAALKKLYKAIRKNEEEPERHDGEKTGRGTDGTGTAVRRRGMRRGKENDV